MADSESGSPSSYSRLIVSIGLSRLVSEIFGVTDRQTDNADHYYSWPPHFGKPANKGYLVIVRGAFNKFQD